MFARISWLIEEVGNTYHEEQIHNSEDLDVVALMNRDVGQLHGFSRFLNARAGEELFLQRFDFMSAFVVLALDDAEFFHLAFEL